MNIDVNSNPLDDNNKCRYCGIEATIKRNVVHRGADALIAGMMGKPLPISGGDLIITNHTIDCPFKLVIDALPDDDDDWPVDEELD